MPLRFNLEALYVEKGTSVIDGTTTGDIKLAYIDFPFTARYLMETTGSIKPFIMAGAEIGLKASCTVSAHNSSASASLDCDQDPEEIGPVKSVDYGLVFGVGASSHNLSATVRYDLGLANINDSGASTVTVKNTAWLFLVGYNF